MGVVRKLASVYYGWWMVSAGFCIQLFTGAVIVYGFTAIVEPLANEFGWSYTQISIAASIRGTEVGILIPLTGWLADRWGSRKLIWSGVTITGLALILVGHVSSLTMFYVTFVLIAVGMSAISMTVLTTGIAKWFQRNLGMAAGILVCGMGFSGLLVRVVVMLVDELGWRSAIADFGLFMLIVLLPISFVFRGRPEHDAFVTNGKPDGNLITGNYPQRQIAEQAAGFRQFVKTRTFWHITIPFSWQLIALMAVTTHMMPYLSSLGVARATSSFLAGGVPLLSIVGRLSFGWLADKFDKRRVTAAALISMSLGLFFLYVEALGFWVFLLFLVLFGIGFGGMVTMSVALVRECFGTVRFGTIHGFMFGLGALVAAAGPPLAGWVFDKWGTYQPIWGGFAGLLAFAALVAITMPSQKWRQAVTLPQHLIT